MSEQLRVLVVEDHVDLAANIVDFLTSMGHVVDVAYRGNMGLRLAEDGDFDVVVLDVNVPGINGFEICAALRQAGSMVPILFLTARDTLDDKLYGFRQGGDDYLTKPFALEELQARVMALHIRAQGMRRELVVEDLRIVFGTGEVTRSGVSISLNPMGLRLLTALARRSPEIVSRRTLEHILWKDEPPDSDALRSQIYILRRKIDRPFDVPLLHTVRGLGFQLARKDGHHD